ncbi:hypothetical protein [Paenibacillus andongensis]|uniref:hypothetical protein n=1 Tax=Paenibacillus andongensis TaxID=2975482 RepID=UPI0021BA9D63|nr:hypothetical protein [Paenibacillus andongensis]
MVIIPTQLNDALEISLKLFVVLSKAYKAIKASFAANWRENINKIHSLMMTVTQEEQQEAIVLLKKLEKGVLEG